MRGSSIAFEEKELSKAEAVEGKLSKQDEEKLMHTVLEHDNKKIEEGKLISEALNQGFSSFMPDNFFDQLTKNYSMAEHLYGSEMMRLLSGYDPSYLKKNINIPEFQRELKRKLAEKSKEMYKEGLSEKDGTIKKEGVKLASLVMYSEELDKLKPSGLMGEELHNIDSIYGEKAGEKAFVKGMRYKDIALRRSVRMAVRRGHSKLEAGDLRAFERQSKGNVVIVYGMDASGSMRGRKIDAAKKAGIALAYKAVSQKDKVGLVVFGTEVKDVVHPTVDFPFLLEKITSVKASKETNITETIRKAIEMFPSREVTKHLVLLTDALPTIGKEPEQEALEAVSCAVAAGITISLVGIKLDKKGKNFAEKIVRVGRGRLYVVRDVNQLDTIVLEDYYSVVE